VHGAIQGRVATPEGEALPGVEVTISSPQLIGGAQSVITGGNGRFRFVALPPGTYTAEARLQGFNPQKRGDLRLTMTATLTVDFALEVGTLEESIEVIGLAPIIDVKDSQMNVHVMPRVFLEKIPSSRNFEDQLAFAPGAKGAWGSFYGAPDSLENKYMTDGLNTSNPEDGAPAHLVDYDSVEEFNVMGIGSPSEYGGFGGATINVVTKSGGNDLSGLFTFHMQMPKWYTANWGDYPYLVRRTFNEYYNVHLNLGGPFIKDKLWFYTSGVYNSTERHNVETDIKGRKGDQERIMGKLSWQISKNDRLIGFVEKYWRKSKGVPDIMSPGLVSEYKADDFFLNFSYLHIFSETTFLEARAGGFLRDALLGEKDTPSHFDLITEITSGNIEEYMKIHRAAYTFNASISHHADDFLGGSHDFKLGVDFGRYLSEDARLYPGGKFYNDLDGEDYYLVDHWGRDVEPVFNRINAFIQDSWTIGERLTINPGLRIHGIKGWLPRYQDEAVFTPKLGIAPRLGITYDIFGDHSTVLKAHYGKYYHQTRDLMFSPMEPQTDYKEWTIGWRANELAEEIFVEEGEYPDWATGYPYDDDVWALTLDDPWEPYKIDPDLKHPYMQQFVVGIERELGKDMSVGATFIYRTNHDLLDRINMTGEWEPQQWTDPYIGKTHTVYKRTNAGENEFYITNPKKDVDYGAAYPGIVGFDPKRSNRTFEIVFRKRYSNGWQFQTSFVTGYSWGNDDNSWGDYGASHSTALGASQNFSSPNYQINAEGPLSLSSTYLWKTYASYDIPVIDLTIGIDLRIESGNRYSRIFWLPPSIDPDPVGTRWMTDVFIFGEKRSSYKLPAMKNLNVRLEKFFRFGKVRVGALLDIFNALNWDSVTYVEEEHGPWGYQFGYVWDIQSTRRFKFGLRFEF